jgi:cytochrome c biogenesis protein CcmG/thiol:disulfide interchange protein DsbE
VGGAARGGAALSGRAAAVALGLALLCACSEPPPDAQREPAPAPGFSLPDLAGRTVSLADLAGRIVVIDFWATWCAPCQYQIPVLNELHATWRDRGVEVLGVSVDAGPREAVAAYAEEHAIGYRVLLGDEALARRYGAPGFPALAIVRPDGALDSLHVGVIRGAELGAAIERIRDEAAAN